MKYKALALDIDGTLLNNRKEISQRNREAIRAFHRRGGRLILSSGRPTYGLLWIANALRLADNGGALLSFNGAMITDCHSQEVVFSQSIDNRYPRILYRYAKEAGMEIASYDKAFVISEDCNNPYIRKEIFLNKMVPRPVDNFILSIPRIVPKCLIVGEPEPLHALELKMKDDLGADLSISRSEPFFLEIMTQGVDKGASLERLLAHWGMSREELIACGDGYNDLTMLQYAGLGVAMGNAQPEVKALADRITLSNEEDGVAAIIEELF